MKLSKIYSNKKEIFEPIIFNDTLNVIFAKVYNPKKSDKDSHNLGKTLLISLINFLLLDELDQKHFLYVNLNRFKDFVFFLEIQINENNYITIRRAVDKNTKVAFKYHDQKNQDYSNIPDNQWDGFDLPIRRAKMILNEKLDFKILKDEDQWTYRKGITYFLRDQNDWNDLFMVSKFIRSQHNYWKPYLIKLFGFDDKKVIQKYNTDEEIEHLNTTKEELQTHLDINSDEYDKLKGHIEIKENEIKLIRNRMDNFNFFKEEIKMNTKLVEEIEKSISDLNEELYNVKFEADRIMESLKNETEFNIEKVKEVFSDINVQFKENLLKDLKDLINFNKKITTDRNIRLKKRLEELQKREGEIVSQLEENNQEREKKLSFLKEQDTFKKYKIMQNQAIQVEATIINLKIQLQNMDKITKIENQIKIKETQKDELIEEIEKNIQEGNPLWSSIRLAFNDIVRGVLGCEALLSIKINNQGNPDFEFGILNETDLKSVTSQSEGTSYKKLLCAAFDLAVLKTYSNENFYHFAYHDGILEGLDNRKKKKFLAKVTNIINESKIQYIITLIEDDLPRDDNDNKIYFKKEEIIKELHDKGDDGRLFKMPIF